VSKSNVWENGQLLLVFNNTAFAGLGDAGGLQPSATAGSLYVGLHTADPGEAGDQTTNETSYTSYARAAVARTSGGWTVTGNQAANTAAIDWPQCTGGSATVTHFSIGTASSGAGKLLYKGAFNSPLAVSNNVVPQVQAGQITATED
jgi:hypothetical protein